MISCAPTMVWYFFELHPVNLKLNLNLLWILLSCGTQLLANSSHFHIVIGMIILWLLEFVMIYLLLFYWWWIGEWMSWFMMWKRNVLMLLVIFFLMTSCHNTESLSMECCSGFQRSLIAHMLLFTMIWSRPSWRSYHYRLKLMILIWQFWKVSFAYVIIIPSKKKLRFGY